MKRCLFSIFALLLLISGIASAMPFGWRPIDAVFPSPVRDLHVDPRSPGVVYALTDSGLVLGSTDFGTTWEPRNTSPQTVFSLLAVDSSRKETLYGFAPDSPEGSNSIWISGDAGRNWTFAGSSPGTLRSIAPSPFIPGLLLAATGAPGSTLLISDDEGHSWTDIGIQSDSASPIWHSTAQWMSFFGVHFSDDYGKTWTERSRKEISACGFQIPPKLFSVSKAGVFYSLDQGRSWWPINQIANDTIFLNPNNPDQILIGTSNQESTSDPPILRLSVDGGKTFNDWNSGLVHPVTDCVMPADWMFLCVQSGKVYAYNETRADLDSSRRVDGGDLAVLSIAFGSRSGDPLYAPDADFNADGAIDGSDLAILSSLWGHRFYYDEPKTPGDFPMNPAGTK